jgi:hypothetical protein
MVSVTEARRATESRDNRLIRNVGDGDVTTASFACARLTHTRFISPDSKKRSVLIMSIICIDKFAFTSQRVRTPH